MEKKESPAFLDCLERLEFQPKERKVCQVYQESKADLASLVLLVNVERTAGQDFLALRD